MQTAKAKKKGGKVLGKYRNEGKCLEEGSVGTILQVLKKKGRLRFDPGGY